MDLPATSLDIKFLHLDGTPLDQPREWTEALIEISVAHEMWTDVTLTLNEAPIPVSLRRIGGRIRIIANWPRMNAGSYEIRALLGDAVFMRRARIAPAKISQRSFESLLADLECRLPASVAIGLQRTGGLGGWTLLPPEESTTAQEIARLRLAVHGSADHRGLTSILRELAADPHHCLRQEERWVCTELARRPHPSRLIHAVRAQTTIKAGSSPSRIIDQRVITTVDTYENRLVRLYHDQVEQRLFRLQHHLEATGSNRLYENVADVVTDLKSSRREAAFLDEVVSIPHLPASVTMVLLKRPAYRAAFEGFLQLHRRISVRLNDPRLDLPLNNLPWLYQLWGTLGTIAALLDTAASYGFRLDEQQLVRRVGTWVYLQPVPAGKTAVRLVHAERGTVISLVPERSFGSTGAIQSVSFLQIPDITIAIESPGIPPQLLLFDPKYKLENEAHLPPDIDGRPRKADIDKMHAYRDAIRDSSGRHVVSKACIIYPGPTVVYEPGIVAIAGTPSESGMLEAEIKRLVEPAIASHLGQGSAGGNTA